MTNTVKPIPDGYHSITPFVVCADYCEDVDAVFARAVSAGATVREPVQTFVTGDRYGSIVDPAGRRWAIMTRVEDVSRTEADRRVSEWLAGQPAPE